MKLFGCSENKITKNKNGETVPHLEIIEIAIVHCKIINNNNQQDLTILCAFVPNKVFSQL